MHHRLSFPRRLVQPGVWDPTLLLLAAAGPTLEIRGDLFARRRLQ